MGIQKAVLIWSQRLGKGLGMAGSWGCWADGLVERTRFHMKLIGLTQS